ncbi:MAG: class I SAM-dependent methyltransferase [Gammaproteobacteria bacterium]|nr:class I SAM-dependent methyltransferase [Gammaproteobacteria bacterium]
MGDGNYDDNGIGYQYRDTNPTWSNSYLWPVVKEIVNKRSMEDKRVFELGCGNGATADMLQSLGFDVVGVDPSETGIELGKKAFPGIELRCGSAYDNLSDIYGTFPLVVSLEVIEHCYYPRKVAQTLFNLLESGGIGIISTPYHGYWKNLALSITGKWDRHFTVLWDDGHIKFFSINTMHRLLAEVGFQKINFLRIGRLPPFAKSLVAIVEK